VGGKKKEHTNNTAGPNCFALLAAKDLRGGTSERTGGKKLLWDEKKKTEKKTEGPRRTTQEKSLTETPELKGKGLTDLDTLEGGFLDDAKNTGVNNK